jgi:hypothetical protein
VAAHWKKLTAAVLFVARRKLGRGSEKGNMGRNWD